MNTTIYHHRDDYHILADVVSPTDDRIRIAWCYPEAGEFAPVRVLVEDSEGGAGVAYLTPDEGEEIAQALLAAVTEGRRAMKAGVPVRPDTA